MIQKMEDIIRRFCAYGMEYKDHEGEITLTGGKRVKPPIACGSHEKKYSNYPATVKDTHEAWKRACETAAKPFTIIKLIGKNSVEVRLTEEFSRKHPVFPVSLVEPYFQTGEETFPCRKKTSTPPDIVEKEDFPGLVKKIIKATKTRLNGKDQRQYLVRFKEQTADKDKWLAEDAIPDGKIHLRKFRASRCEPLKYDHISKKVTRKTL
ncbi:hypothetical protein O181_026002 [Austropuccinia psidii MF-1]|uniref:Uncharacterized protein n=1 Tax=Austropuccinia psidii MF-1 TaxID=1389203 RepID=A0A9Q3CPP5_9BASI|nr:hypothetical protein [Austropuccinia psidii MF-1]